MKLIRLISAVIFAIFFAGCTEKETQVEVSSVSLNTATIEMVEGETFNLVATILPKDAEYDKVIWASSNASVARVNSGTVAAVKEGTATITASAGGKSSTCTVKVSAKVVAVTSITLDKTSLSMKVGETETITATVNPDNATDKTVDWGSSDVAVATVADGIITARKSGEAIITAKSGSCIAKCKVTITVSAESVTLDKTTLSLAVGETAQLTATVKPDDATDKNVAWTSSDASVAKVDNGKVTAVKSGKATITAKCGGKTAECAVTVTVPTGSVTLDKTSLSLAVGETAQLTATVKPDDATDKNVIWTSSDELVARVANGKVTAVKAGNATITANCGDKTAECAVTVTVPITSLTLDKTSLSLAVGETAQLTATVKPDDATDKNVIWTSSDELVARVANGKVTAVKAGNATITANCGDKTAECAVTVTVPITSLTLDKTSLSLAVGETAQLTATVKPDNATDKTVTWCSSNESIVKVSNGEVSAVSEGTAIISAALGDKLAQCTVTVSVPNNIIYYTSSDQNIITPYNTGAFGSNIIANKYEHGLGRIVFDGPVTKIGKAAFYQCRTLITIQLPSTITIIDNNSFNECRNLKSIAIPYGVTKIGDNAFLLCNRLSSVSIPNSVTSIGSDAFSCCFDFTTIRLPETVRSIGSSCFFACDGLREINIPSSLTKIEDKTFQGCKNLNINEIPRNIKSVGNAAFRGCTNIKNITLHEMLVSIGDYAFCDTAIDNLIIPNSVTTIGISAFYSCKFLNSIVFGRGITTVPRSCFSESGISEVSIPEGYTNIDSWAFSGCGNLSIVNLPSTINSIGYRAFYDHNSNLKSVYIKAIMPPNISDRNPKDTFAISLREDLCIFVPRASVDAYKSKWSDYKDYIQGYDF